MKKISLFQPIRPPATEPVERKMQASVEIFSFIATPAVCRSAKKEKKAGF
ncbi:MAG: hypothetical protein VZQ80_06040 [Lachnospiraceae bacterium]|nr:hypothetical protein [Lachnospiraceae bacterium]